MNLKRDLFAALKLFRRYHFHFIDFSVTILASSTHYNVCVEICYQLYCVVCDTQHQTTQYTKHKRENQVERREATKKELVKTGEEENIS